MSLVTLLFLPDNVRVCSIWCDANKKGKIPYIYNKHVSILLGIFVSYMLHKFTSVTHVRDLI